VSSGSRRWHRAIDLGHGADDVASAITATAITGPAATSEDD
jgi:hypothetical protein